MFKKTQSEHTKIKPTHIVSNHMICFSFRRIDHIGTFEEQKVSIAYQKSRITVERTIQKKLKRK